MKISEHKHGFHFAAVAFASPWESYTISIASVSVNLSINKCESKKPWVLKKVQGQSEAAV